ncbi:MAG: hypothetical protein OXH79_21740 [Boseongicola sp.]|nr:hypothetical protein [Boseongicola sp.]
MPLDNFQKDILRVIASNRDASSPFAGGSVIQRHRFRLSDDQDVFTAGDPDPVMRKDVEALEANGLHVSPGRAYDGFRECHVMKPKEGRAILQWTQALALEYFAPVEDSDFGYRLHFADLAANMALAAASRKRMRDFADLWLLDTHVMPLWRMACAASGKFPNESPLSLVDLMSFNMQLAMVQDDTPMILTRDVSEAAITGGLTKSMQEARETLGRLGAGFMDRLQVDGDGLPVTESKVTETGQWISPVRGGAMPSFDGIDGEMIKSLVKAFHENEGTSAGLCHS